MLNLRFVISMLTLGLTVLCADVVSGQNYPNKPIRIIAIEPGGSGDFITRLFVPGLSSNLGQPVIVDNRVATLVTEMVAKARPDGYTLLSYASPVWILPLMQNTNYDAVRDFSPITWVTVAPFVLVVHPSVPANSVKDLITLAQAKPGQLNYAAGVLGGGNHLAGELFKAMAGVNIVAIPYKSGGTAMTDLIGGQVQLMFSSVAAIGSYIKSGKLKSLAVTTLQPSALFPDLPTVAASGLPGFESSNKQIIWAPAKTPEIIIRRLNQEIVRILNLPDVKQTYINAGYEIVGDSPEQLAAMIKSEIAKWGKVIKDADIHAD